MTDVTLTQVALFLAAAVVAAPLAKLLRIGNVLGYLLVGVLIGPFGLGFVYSVYEVSSILHFAEFGVVLLLFLIGLELRPKRLWALRTSIFGVGGAIESFIEKTTRESFDKAAVFTNKFIHEKGLDQ